MRIPKLLLFSLTASLPLVTAVDLDGYEYVVVGSGAGGGPLAARLALAGHKTLLIEAGDDQGNGNYNYSVPSYSARASEDSSMAWNFFVRHYADDARQALDYKTTYEVSGGGGEDYTGLDPPEGAVMKGVLYPRTGTLGGCTAHNALIAFYPYRSDFEHIAALTGDNSWSPDNMRKHFIKLENNDYVPSLPLLPSNGHGYKGWLNVEPAPLPIALTDPQLLSVVLGGAFSLGNLTDKVFNIASLLAGDGNSEKKSRDKTASYYQIPLSSDGGRRVGSRDFIVSVRDAKDSRGNKRYPLDVRTNCHVTKIIFDNQMTTPRATGVEFLDGQYLYSASPRSKTAKPGIPGSAKASREVIISGGAYNSPQILKLSGIGPAEELKKFDIPVVVDLPGVGTNLQDHYEVAVQGRLKSQFLSLKYCKFADDPSEDPCLDDWENPLLGYRGSYSSAGLGATMCYPSSQSDNGDFDAFIFGGPVNFRGYFPNYSQNITADKNIFTWAILKGHPRNTAGSVTLRSSNPLDTPSIVYNYFDTGSPGSSKDIQAITEAISLARNAFTRQPLPVEEVLPGKEVQTKEQIAEYIKNTAWGHHASSTCPIGADGDPMAVLDSKFRVRGVRGLRVVDASVYPLIPGTFTAVSTYMVGEKAASDILSEL